MKSIPALSDVVLVTGGENRSALALTRSLGRYGCKVIVVGESKRNLASSSKYSAGSYAVHRSAINDIRFADEIDRVVRQEQVGIVYPMTEPDCLALAQYRDHLNCLVAVPEYEKLTNIFDKCNVFRKAETLGVAIPQTTFIKGREDFLNKRKEFNTFPVVVKPGMSKIPVENGYIHAGIKYARNLSELDELFESNEALRYPSMIQEKIVGDGTGLFTLFDGNDHLALFSHKRLREKPPSGGVSVFSESVAIDTEMVLAAQKLLSDVDWQGVAMVEFKRDLRDGKAKLMEINGRFWGTLQLAIFAGVDFPVLLHDFLQGKPPKRTPLYEDGVKMKWLLGTLDHLLIRLRNSSSSLELPPDAPGKMKAFLQFLNLKGQNTVFDVLSGQDFGPFRHELMLYIKNIFGRCNVE